MTHKLLATSATGLHCVAIVGAFILLVGRSHSLDQRVLAESARVTTLPARTRATLTKPTRSTLAPSDLPDVLVVKFREGTRVRQRGGQLTAVGASKLSAREARLRERFKLDDGVIANDLATVNLLVGRQTGFHVDRLFGRPEDVIEAEQKRGETAANEELADLNLYYVITTAQPNRAAAEVLLDQLNALDSVELAYAESESQPAGDIAPPTPDFTAEQDYLGSFGIDADYAHSRNARGQGVKIIDVEGNWNFTHEDVPPMFTTWGYPLGSDWKQHGTAVLGVLAAGDNGYGMKGIAPSASVGAVAHRFIPYPGANIVKSIARAIDEAAARLGPGDVILIEIQIGGPDSGLECTCSSHCDDGDGFEYVAAEYDQATFDAIRHATAAHVIVVELAGNGSMNLDDARYGGRFDRNVRDSGAIVVGASQSADKFPACWTNHGSRVDVHGWGRYVATLGTGDLAKVHGSDQRQWYRSFFGGTSAASAMVAGAVASVQSFLIGRGLRLFSEEMRYLMVNAGYAQASHPHHIGPIPNLRALLGAYEKGDTCVPIVIQDTMGEERTFVPPFGRARYCFGVGPGQIGPNDRYLFETCANPTFDTVIEVQTPSRVVARNNDGCGPGSRGSRIIFKPAVAGTHYVNVTGAGNASGDLILRFSRLPIQK